MKKRINKVILKFSLCCAMLISCISFMVCKTYAWHENSSGNLVSDNIYSIGSYSSSINGVSMNVNNQTLILNGTSSNGSWNNRTDLTITLNAGTYTMQWFTDYIGNNIGFGLRSSNTGLTELYQLNTQRYRTFTINEQTTFTTVIWWQTSNMSFDNVKVSCMVYEGNYKNYTMFEPYGKTYYNYDVVEKASLMSYGCFKYASSIKVYYNNGTTTNLYKEFSNITDFTLENYVRFTNNILYIDDYKLIFTLLGGNSNWKYTIDISFSSGQVKISDFQEWYIYADSSTTITSFTSGVSYSTSVGGNPLVVNLTSQGFSSNDYISNVVYTRRNPNIALARGGLGTPNLNSSYYNNGYNSGYDVGYDDGYNVGFDDSKSEHYAMGYNDGYRDGEESDFTTNGFKTLIGSIFNYPINMIRSIFNFEFMGINIFSIIVFVMSIGIVIFVIRRFKK